MNLDFHPTLTRTWSRQGRRGQRRARAPVRNRKLVGFGAIDWRYGWVSHGVGWRRDTAVICLQLAQLVERSQAQGRIVLRLWEYLWIHTRRGPTGLWAWLDEHDEKLLAHVGRPIAPTQQAAAEYRVHAMSSWKPLWVR